MSPSTAADPSVIAHHLPRAVYDANHPAAIATFNVRGVGRSGGSQPWPGWGIGSDGDDFAAVERAVLDLVGDVAIYRLVSSAQLPMHGRADPRDTRTAPTSRSTGHLRPASGGSC